MAGALPSPIPSNQVGNPAQTEKLSQGLALLPPIAPLAAGVSYQSVTYPCIKTVDRVTGIVSADVAGTLEFLQSPDNGATVLVTDTLVVPAQPAGVGLPYSFELTSEAFALRYVNGAAPQTVFVLSTLLKG